MEDYLNVFEAVKSSVSARQAAERYGVKVNRYGMARCPFHNDRTPSMKLDKRFHCFGCQADGDVIDFVARVFDLPVKEAAIKLAEDFGIYGWDHGRNRTNGSGKSVKKWVEGKTDFEALKKRIFHVYSEYFFLLQRWRTELAPASMDEEWDPRFIEALQKQDQVEYILDTLTDGTSEEIADMVSDLASKVDVIEEKIAGKEGGLHGNTNRV